MKRKYFKMNLNDIKKKKKNTLVTRQFHKTKL